MHHATTTDETGRGSKASYLYTVDGQLDKSWGATNFDFNYDENGNMISHSRDADRQMIVYGPGDRVESYDNKKVVYDPNGFVTAIDAEKFLFNARGQLTEYLKEGEVRVRYYYDQLSRMVGWTDSRGGAAQYFYTNPLKPHQVTYIIPKNEATVRLSYDHNGHLLQLESADSLVYVATDHQGSPVLLFKPNGSVLKRMQYSPFGLVLVDTKPGLHLPIGFQGRLTSKHASFLVADGGRVYSPDILQWLSPDWTSLLTAKVENPSALFVYRFMNNNPLKMSSTPYMTSMADWARLYNLDVDHIFQAAGKLRAADPALPEHTVRTDLLPSSRLLSETAGMVDSAVDQLKELAFIHPLEDVIDHHRVDLVPKFSSRPPHFGRGFLLSVIDEADQLVVVNPVQVQNSVIQDVFQTVLNNSLYLDLSYDDLSTSVYYFVKPNLNRFSLDSDSVRRLAGEFSIASKEIDHGKELSIVNNRFEVRILYGSPAATYRSNLLKAFSGQAVNRAWLREKEIVSRGFSGAGGDWSPSETAELLRTGVVRGYDVVEIQPVDRFPKLALDGSNREFIKFGQRSRRNRHGRRKHAQD